MRGHLSGLAVGFAVPPSFGRYREGFGFEDRETGVGGSELLLLDTSEALASEGALVTVFLADRRGWYTTRAGAVVEFRPFGEVSSWAGDVLVLYRFGVSADALPRNSRIVGWVADPPALAAPADTIQLASAVEHIVALSPYQAGMYERFMDENGWGGARRPTVSVIPPGVFPVEIQQHAKVPDQAIFCSVPEQGLDVLLDAWPAIRAERPSARLIVTSDYTLWGLRGEADDWRARFAKDQGVVVSGAVPRSRLLRLQAESTLHLHPALVPENFCISSLECQAAGTPTITSNVGAMTTTVVDGSTGICIPAEPAASFVERYVERTLEIWTHPEDLAAMASRARARAIEEFDYATVARQWAAVIV